MAPSGTYSRLQNLIVAENRRVPDVGTLIHEIYRRWGRPARIVADRFRLGELQDAIGPAGPYIEPRVTRWSEATQDIRALSEAVP